MHTVKKPGLFVVFNYSCSTLEASLNSVHFAGFVKRLRTSVAQVKLRLQLLTCGRVWGPGSGCCCHTGGRCRAVWSHACATPPPHPHLHSVSCTAHHDWGSVTAHTQRGVSIRNWTHKGECRYATGHTQGSVNMQLDVQRWVSIRNWTHKGECQYVTGHKVAARFSPWQSPAAVSCCRVPASIPAAPSSVRYSCLAVSYLLIVSAHLSTSVTSCWSTVYDNNKQFEWRKRFLNGT